MLRVLTIGLTSSLPKIVIIAPTKEVVNLLLLNKLLDLHRVNLRLFKQTTFAVFTNLITVCNQPIV